MAAFGLLSICPSVKVGPKHVRIRSHWMIDILTLGSFTRWAEVDSQKQLVTVVVRYLWVFRKTDQVPFNMVTCVLYEMIDHTSDAQYMSGSREGSEQFDVGLRVYGRKYLLLGRFTGDGARVTDFSWEPLDYVHDVVADALDVTGKQAESSVELVDLLCHRLGVDVGVNY